LRTQIDNIVDTVAAGEAGPALLQRLKTLETEQQHLSHRLADTPPEPVRLHPNVAGIYMSKVNSLRYALNADDARDKVAQILRSLVDAIRLHPVDGVLQVELVGDLAKLIGFAHAADAKKPGSAWNPGRTEWLVAGAGSVSGTG
jgi:site-specific DNA recombinase